MHKILLIYVTSERLPIVQERPCSKVDWLVTLVYKIYRRFVRRRDVSNYQFLECDRSAAFPHWITPNNSQLKLIQNISSVILRD